MVRQMLIHFEHADPVLTPKDLLQLVVSHDFPFVLRVLQVVLANVVPDFRNDLAARQRSAARNRSEIRRRLNRASQSAPCLACAFCHLGPPVVLRLIERKANAIAMPLQREFQRFAIGNGTPRLRPSWPMSARPPKAMPERTHHCSTIAASSPPNSGSLGSTSVIRPSRSRRTFWIAGLALTWNIVRS